MHKETEAATLQQQLEAAKSAYLFMLVPPIEADSSCSLLTMYVCFAEAAADAAENLNNATRRVADLEKRLKAAEVREESAIGRLSAASTTLTGTNFPVCLRYLRFLQYGADHVVHVLC